MSTTADTASALLAASQPRYAALAAHLARSIAAGEYPVGALLPTEGKLSAEHSVSRATVREALRRLRGLGLVSAEHGIGTRVAARHPPRAGYEMVVRSLAGLMGYDGPTLLKVHERGHCRLEAGVAMTLGLPPGMAVWRVAALRVPAEVGAPPLAQVEMLVPDGDAALVADLPPGVPLYRLIERALDLPLTEMRQEITAVALSEVEAANLHLAPGAPGLRIVRRFYAAGERLLEATVNLHPAAERFTYAIRLAAPGEGPEKQLNTT